MDSGEHINGEYYASVPYQLMVENGLSIYVHEVEKFCQRGTPEDLEEYNQRSIKIHDENHNGNSTACENENDAKTYKYRKEYFDHPQVKRILEGE